MTITNNVLKEALTLRPSEKAQLIDKLLSSLDKPDKDLDELWAGEAEDRIDAYDQGKIKVISLDKVLQKYRQKMRINFLEIAQIELDDAIDYYNYELPSLGDAFLTEVLNALDRIGEYPEAWHPCSKRTRRCQTRRFPYGIIYQLREQEILVVAIANLHRKPDYWKDRIQNCPLVQDKPCGT